MELVVYFDFKTIPMSLINKYRNQRKDIIRNATKEVIFESVRSNNPFILERSDFTQKKMNMTTCAGFISLEDGIF